MTLLYTGSFVVAFTHIALSQDALTLQVHNYKNPFFVEEGVASEIVFSILGADDFSNYSLALAQETATSFYTRCSLSVSSANCWSLKRDDCQCVNLGQGRRGFKLTVMFEASHMGQWMFAVWSHNVTPVFFNVTFLQQPTEEMHTTSNVLQQTTGYNLDESGDGNVDDVLLAVIRTKDLTSLMTLSPVRFTDRVYTLQHIKLYRSLNCLQLREMFSVVGEMQ